MIRVVNKKSYWTQCSARYTQTRRTHIIQPLIYFSDINILYTEYTYMRQNALHVLRSALFGSSVSTKYIFYSLLVKNKKKLNSIISSLIFFDQILLDKIYQRKITSVP